MCFQEATGATAEKAGQMLAPLPLLSVAFVHPEQPMEVPPCAGAVFRCLWGQRQRSQQAFSAVKGI